MKRLQSFSRFKGFLVLGLGLVKRRRTTSEFQTAILRNNCQDSPSLLLMASTLVLLGAAELKMFWNWLIYEITYSKCTYFCLLCLALAGLLGIVFSQQIAENG